MERTRRKQNHFEYYLKGSHTIQDETTPATFNSCLIEEIQHTNFLGDDNGCSGFKRQRYIGSTPSFELGFPLKDVFSKKTGWGSTSCIRSQRPEQVRSYQAFSVNLSDRCSRFSTRKRLDGKDRYPTSLFSSAHCRISSSVPKSSVQQSGTSADSTALWPVFSPPDICNFVQLGCGDLASKRHTTFNLPRRLHSSKSGSVQIAESGLGDLEHSREPRLACKPPQVCVDAFSRSRVSRSLMEHKGMYHNIASEKGNKDKINNRKCFKEGSLYLKRDSKITGTPQFCKHDNTEGPFALSTHATVSKEFYSSQPEKEERYSPNSAARLILVAECHRPQFGGPAQKRGDTFFNHRRIGCGLGCSPQRNVHEGDMVNTPEVLALQPEGVICRTQCRKSTETMPEECTCTSPIRQQHTSGIHKKRGRNKVLSTTRVNNESSGSNREVEYLALGGVSPGEIQRHSRPPISESTSAGMALVAPGLGGRIQSLGRTRRRLVRVTSKRCRRPLRNLGLQRWVSNFLRRLQSSLEFRAGVGIPTAQSNSKSPTPPQYSKRYIHRDSATLDTMLLVDRFEGESSSGTIPNREPSGQPDRPDNRQDPSASRKAGTSCMESWGWADQVAHWSTDERHLLQKSWRESTLVTYKAPISRWVSWCTCNNVNPKTPQGDDVARFLAKLCLEDKLAYRTILLHKSAISTYTAASKEDIAKNFFVHQILKAISLVKPPEKKMMIWDTKQVFDWLKDTPKSGTLFDIARRTAVILLLASGRRIHDLTLLDLSKENFNIDDKGEQITLWPRFGSKTDNAETRQSGWLLKQHPEKYFCPVGHIRELITATENRRTEEPTLTSLFISIKGRVKPATQTIIAGWIKTIFKEVGIEATPGSVRSAVASRSFTENRPIEEILKRANWKSSDTLTKFYCRKVRTSNSYITQDKLLDNFSIL